MFLGLLVLELGALLLYAGITGRSPVSLLIGQDSVTAAAGPDGGTDRGASTWSPSHHGGGKVYTL